MALSISFTLLFEALNGSCIFLITWPAIGAIKLGLDQSDNGNYPFGLHTIWVLCWECMQCCRSVSTQPGWCLMEPGEGKQSTAWRLLQPSADLLGSGTGLLGLWKHCCDLSFSSGNCYRRGRCEGLSGGMRMLLSLWHSRPKHCCVYSGRLFLYAPECVSHFKELEQGVKPLVLALGLNLSSAYMLINVKSFNCWPLVNVLVRVYVNCHVLIVSAKKMRMMSAKAHTMCFTIATLTIYSHVSNRKKSNLLNLIFLT